MRLIEVLPSYEVNRFNRVPVFSDSDRKHYFKMENTIEKLLKHIKNPDNKVGLLLSYGYFKASGKFYSQKVFNTQDVRFVSKILGIDISKDFSKQYTDRMRQKHRLLILNACGYVKFSNAEVLFESLVEDLLSSQMDPRKLFHVLLETLRSKKLNYQAMIKLQNLSQQNLTFLKKMH